VVDTYQVHDDLAVRVSLENGRLLELLAKGPVVVDFAVDGEKDLLVIGNQRLSAGVCVRTQP
jgi:hypothetical protein